MDCGGVGTTGVLSFSLKIENSLYEVSYFAGDFMGDLRPFFMCNVCAPSGLAAVRWVLSVVTDIKALLLSIDVVKGFAVIFGWQFSLLLVVFACFKW